MCRTYKDGKPDAYLRLCSRTGMKGKRLPIQRLGVYDPARFVFACQAAQVRQRIGTLYRKQEGEAKQ